MNDIISMLAEKYYVLYPEMVRIPVRVEVCECISDAYLRIRPEHEHRMSRQALDEINGMVALPKTIEEPISILISKNRVLEYTNDKSMTWVGTFAHELTHAIDFYQIARKGNHKNYDSFQEADENRMFQLWTEYHAKKLGYSFLRSVLEVDLDSNNIDGALEYIITKEWPAQKERFFQEYRSTHNANEQMYLSMHILGRYSVWCDLFPSEFNSKSIENEFPHHLWMKDLLEFLRKHETLDAISEKFDYFEDVLKLNWVF
jgi:hypothetical protein